MSIDELYGRTVKGGRMMCHHMPYLSALARGYPATPVVVEFGVRAAPSTIAWLHGGARLYSYDPACRPQDQRVYKRITAAVGERWTFTQASSLDVEIPACDILMHDSLHNYDQVKAELELHANKVADRMLFHDSVYLGSFGQPAYNGEDPKSKGTAAKYREDVMGIRLAIDEFQIANPEWRIERHDPLSNGLLTLRKWA